MERVERVLGVAPKRAHARRILTGLGLAVRERGAIFEVEVPSFRRDLAMEDDLAEEIIRVWGYDKIPSTLPGGQTVEVARESDRLRQEDLVRRALAGAGLLEAVASSFTDRARNDALGAGEPLSLLNPLSQDASYLRRHPLDGILGVVAINARRQQSDVRVFEIGKTYEASAGGDTGDGRATLARARGERRAAAPWRGVTARAPATSTTPRAWPSTRSARSACGPRPGPGGALGGFEPDCHASLVSASGEVVAEFGEVAARTRTALGIDAPVFAAAVRLDALPPSRAFPRYQTLPRFPSVERDMAFLVPDPGPSAAAVEAAIRREAGPLLRDVSVFDVFRLPDGQRSVAWRLTFQAEDRTLTDEEINAIHGRVAARVGAELGLTLRGS